MSTTTTTTTTRPPSPAYAPDSWKRDRPRTTPAAGSTYFRRCLASPNRWTAEDEARMQAWRDQWSPWAFAMFVTDPTPPVLAGATDSDDDED